MAIKHRVEYMLRDVDHIPVTMDYATKSEAMDEMIRLSSSNLDVVFLRYRQFESGVQKAGSVKDAVEAQHGVSSNEGTE
jgi:hypothetical protein